METKTLSLTDEIYAELVDGLKTGLDWPHFLAKHGASKGPLYNAVGRFFSDLEPKVRVLNEVQAKLDAAGLTLDSLGQRIKEAEGSLAPLEDRKSTLNEEIETLETKLAEKSEFMKHVGELGKFGFDTEKLRRLQDTLREIGAKIGLKGKEAVSKFFDELKDYDAKAGFEQEIHRFETIIRTKTLEAEKWQAEVDSLLRQHKDLTEAIAAVQNLGRQGVKAEQIVYWDGIVVKIGDPGQLQDKLERYCGILEAAGFDEKALGELTKAAEKYGTPRKVLTALNSFGNLSEIKAATEETQGKEKQQRAILKDLVEKHSHLKSAIGVCQQLLRDKFGLDAITTILATAKMYGNPIQVLKAVESYGKRKAMDEEARQLEARIEQLKKTESQYESRNKAILEQFEELNVRAIELGRTLGSIEEQLKQSTRVRDILNLLQNPVAAGYEEYAPLVLLLVWSVKIWVNENKSRFSLSYRIDEGLEALAKNLGGS